MIAATLLISTLALGQNAPWAVSAQGKRVMIVADRNNADSVKLAEFYAQKRGVPKANILEFPIQGTTGSNGEEMELSELRLLFAPLKSRIAASKTRVDFIVLMKGIPLRVIDGGARFSVDGYVATMNMNIPPARSATPVGDEIRKLVNPYFGVNEAFDSKRFNYYLVTRLEGYTFADARRLVTNSLAAKPNKGPFVLDASLARSAGYGPMNLDTIEAAKGLRARNFTVQLDDKAGFFKPSQPVAGYASWGSNDPNFSADTYKSIRFLPGAVAETYVSTSARTFRQTTGGQSLIADLIAQGVTGVKGYVYEPYTFALARPSILFDRYTDGYTLAESFYMASPLIKWRDTVIGDPLCAPYKK